jgi:hypothetical protein
MPGLSPFGLIAGASPPPPPPPPAPPATIAAGSLDADALDAVPLDGYAPAAADLLDAAVAALRVALVPLGATVHAGWADAGATQPYCAVRDRCGPREYNSERTWIAWGALDVVAYAAGRDQALAVRAAADAALADAPLAFRAGRLLYFRPADRSTEKDPDLATSARVSIQEPRTYTYGLCGP